MSFQTVSFFDSTYLKTKEQANISDDEDKQRIESVVLEAIEHQFKLVMIRSKHIPLAKEMIELHKSKVLVGTVIDFPHGDNTTANKLKEIQSAIDLGSDDIDVVIDYKRFKEGGQDEIAQQVKACTSLCLAHAKTIKWIIESAALNEHEIKAICQLIRDVVLEHFGSNKAQEVFVKSSTGFFVSPNSEPNGATVEAIKLMLEHSSPLPVKASGGIRNRSDFNTMIELGVKRIGTSSALAILQGKSSQSSY